MKLDSMMKFQKINQQLKETQNLNHNTFFEKYNLNVFADDTGLEIKALNNEPGVRSARYAGDHKNSTDNINKILKELHDFEDRSARFKTVFSLITKDFSKLFTGIIYGEITKEVNGSKGFGYDPIFKPNGYSMTFGEIDSRIKNEISHRALATNKLGVEISFIKLWSSSGELRLQE